MPARDEQQEVGKIEAVGEPGGERMRLEMIDRDEGHAASKRDRLPRDHANDQPADQAWPRCRCHAVDRIESEGGLGQRLDDRRVEQLDMGARGDLRHHPAIDGVKVELRAHHARQDGAAAVGLEPHEGGCGLVAARLDAEHASGGYVGRRSSWGFL